MGGKSFYEYTQKPCKYAMMKNDGISESLIDELLAGVVRVRFGQNISNVNGFIGKFSKRSFVSLYFFKT